nr:hypothetical protein [Acetatifactor sp.]
MKKQAGKLILGMAVIALLAIFFVIRNGKTEPASVQVDIREYYEDSYREYLEKCGYTGEMSGEEVPVNLSDYRATDGLVAEEGSKGIATSDTGKISWLFQVPKDGFYNIELSYIPLPGTNSQITRKLYIDKEVLFDGMNQIVFNRYFVNADEHIQKKNKNEIRPASLEIYEERQVYIDDAQKRSIAPYIFYFEAGKHEIALESIKEPMIITDIRLKSQEQSPDYEEYL